MRLQVGHTHEFDRALLDDVHRLLAAVFGPSRGRSDDDFSADDWQHMLGGIHVLAFDDTRGGDLVGHAAIVQRLMTTGGRTYRVGYVEGVGVGADHQRRGIGGQMMAVLESVIERAFDFGALSASDAAIRLYTGRGWALWRGHLSAMTPAGITATPEEEGGVYVWNVDVGIDIATELTCDWRPGDLW